MFIKKKARRTFFLFLFDFAALAGSFNVSYYVYKNQLAPNYAFSWLLLLIISISFSIEYILNLNNFDERRSNNFIINRTFITGVLLIVITNTILFLTPLRYQGGLTGRGIFSFAMFQYVVWVGIIRWVTSRMVRIKLSQDFWLLLGDLETLSPFLVDLKQSKFQSRYEVLTKQFASDKKKLIEMGVKPKRIIGGWNKLSHWKTMQPKGIVLACSDSDAITNAMQNELMQARLSGVRVYDLTDFYEMTWQKVPVLNINKKWFVFSHGFDLIHNPIGIRVKNLIDIVVAISGLIISSPLLLLTSLFVLLDSKGPVIFKQTRTGVNGKPFTLYKFRSMRTDAEKKGAQWASKNDERVTRVGKIIRKLRFDELPQLLNILKGEMSFIGPRPERPEFDKKLKAKIPYYNLRNSLKPGITGWAQVMYPYGASIEDAREKLEYDIYYIKNYSLLLDLTILIRTIKVILHLQGR
ncbi:MAG: exopolysaccharide biosynthesis polyprenyl glycosylphosphotransferase [Leptospirales bacterium]